MPASGSDSAKAPIASPLASWRSHRSRCWSRPACAISSATSELVTDSDTATVALALRDRLDRQRVADVVAAGAAPRLRDRDAEQPVARRRVHHVGRELARLVDAAARCATISRANCSTCCLKASCSAVSSRIIRLRTNATTKTRKHEDRSTLRVSFVSSCPLRSYDVVAARAARRSAAASPPSAPRSSGSTRTLPTTVMKLVSPFQRGTRWTCR